MYRAQSRSGDNGTLPAIRKRGHEILDDLSTAAEGDLELERRLAEARRELDGDEVRG